MANHEPDNDVAPVKSAEPTKEPVTKKIVTEQLVYKIATDELNQYEPNWKQWKGQLASKSRGSSFNDKHLQFLQHEVKYLVSLCKANFHVSCFCNIKVLEEVIEVSLSDLKDGALNMEYLTQKLWKINSLTNGSNRLQRKRAPSLSPTEQVRGLIRGKVKDIILLEAFTHAYDDSGDDRSEGDEKVVEAQLTATQERRRIDGDTASPVTTHKRKILISFDDGEAVVNVDGEEIVVKKLKMDKD